MLETLKWIFETPWHYFGMLLYLAIIAAALSNALESALARRN